MNPVDMTREERIEMMRKRHEYFTFVVEVSISQGNRSKYSNRQNATFLGTLLCDVARA